MASARFLSVEHLPRLTKAMAKGGGKSSTPEGFDEALRGLTDAFGNPRFVARTYVGSHCQGEAEDSERRPLFATVDAFLEGDGDGPLFVLGEAGAGKTSLLVMLKLLHLAGLWPKHHRCELLALGADSLAQIEAIKTPRKTVLLLDGFDGDPVAAAELVRATAGFRRVIITCRTADHRPGLGRETICLSPFNDPQVDKYLKRRFHRMEEPSRKRAKVVLAGMGAVGFRPLVLSAADDFLHSRTKEWTAFSVYHAMFEAWLDREEKKPGDPPFDREALGAAAIKVARLAALGSVRGRVSSEELAGASLTAEEMAQVGRLDGRGASIVLRDSAGALRMSHSSMGEFLIALGLGQGVLQASKKRIPASALMVAFLLEGQRTTTAWKALDLSGTSLVGVALQDADFSGASLSRASLSDLSFSRTPFDNADLKFAKARGVRFAEVDFKAANAAHASASAAVFDRCRFTQASFADTSLAGATFESCVLENTSFADAHLDGATFTKCEITKCNFTSADLSGVRFRDCTFDGSKFDRASLAGASFERTAPVGLSLKRTDLRGAELDEAFLAAIKDPQAAAWDSEVAKRLRFSQSQNAENAAAIDRDVAR